MTTYETITREDHGEGVILLTVNRPRALNALSAQVVTELTQAVAAEAAGAALGGPRAVVVTGAGSKAFVAGADIREMSEMTPAQAKAFSDAGHRLAHAIEEAPCPFIAAVNGYALGGGCELALACDFIYASEQARFGQPEINLGILPGFGGTQRLARRVGLGRARELIYTGVQVGASEALAMGLVNRVLPPDQLLGAALDTARAIAAKGALAVAASKRVMHRGFDADERTGNELEASAFASLFGSHDQREGMTAFLEKRPASFQGR